MKKPRLVGYTKLGGKNKWVPNYYIKYLRVLKVAV